MRRRALLQSVAALFTLQPLARFRRFAPSAVAADLSDANVAALNALAEVVLPASLGRAGRDKAVADFVAWVRNYKEGSDRGHGYGSSTVSAPTPVSPAAKYAPQFAALDKAAEPHGATTFAALPVATRQIVIEAALNQPPAVTRLQARPTGTNLVADVMGFFFNSADGFDLAYNAAIGRDSCRSLDGSDRAPDQYVGRTELQSAPRTVHVPAGWRPGL